MTRAACSEIRVTRKIVGKKTRSALKRHHHSAYGKKLKLAFGKSALRSLYEALNVKLVERYVEIDFRKIRLIFKQVPKTEAGRMAGYWFLAAYQQDKAKAWKMYALAFDRQDKVEADPSGTMRAIAKECGLNAEAVENEVKQNSKTFSMMMDQDAADARDLGLVGTPYYLVNDIIVRGAIPFENFSEAIDLALKHAAK